ncbi:hypothetical protein B1R32_102210 [Abditibacterium utsteinense]|uniref:O-Antigen ligase n=1 Tax=Abditibacterium utsteinense TaxID=1960156 RepID=A0A2S8SWM4_9BACT|nr:hypothetical protein [Abditibacterium utsteinense]PQV65201.1 hypothetical protein B1R32_102210 [Abditibacterium utsteinense]
MTYASPVFPPRAAVRPSRREAVLSPTLMWMFPGWMLLTIAGIFALGARGTWVSAFLLALTVIYYSLRGRWLAASGFYFTYIALEGMYKYTTDFSNVIYVLKPLLVVFMATVWWLGAKRDGKRLVSPPLTPLIACLTGLGLVQSFHPLGDGFLISLATLLLWYIAPTFFYFLICNEVKNAAQVRQILFFLLAITTVISVFGVFQYAIGQAWLEQHLVGFERMARGSATWFGTTESGERVASFRPSSTTAQTGAAATWSFIGIMLSCSYVLQAEREKWMRALMVGLLFINAVGLMVTAVRLFVVIAVMCIALLLLLTARSARQVLRNLLVLALFTVVGWGGFTISEFFSGGILSVRYAATLADPIGKFQQDRGQNFAFLPYFLPLYPLGIGFQRGVGDRQGSAPKSQNSIFIGQNGQLFNRETQFNSVTADLGLPGLLLLVVLLFCILRMGWKTQRALQGPSQSIAALMFVILIGHMISLLGGPLLQGADYFYLMVALLTILPQMGPVSWQETPQSRAQRAIEPPRAR